MNKMKFLERIPKKFENVTYLNDVPNHIKEVATSQIRERLGLYLFGAPGVGKTHIAYAIAKNVIDCHLPIMFLNTTQMLETFRQNFGKELENDEEDLFKEIMNFRGVIFMDDIGAEKASEWTRERLCLIINKKYEDMYPMIFTSNCDFDVLQEKLGDRIVSRIRGMTKAIKITGEDIRGIKTSTETINLDSYAS